jgi:RNA-directed DNA polymerase
MDDLWAQICSFRNLSYAAKKSMRGKRLNNKVCGFHFSFENEIFALQEELLSGQYRPRPFHTFVIHEPKERVISCSTFRDRVVQHAIFHKIAHVFENRLIYHSYACRPGKGTHRAIKQAQIYCRKFPYFLKCDISQYFRSINHDTLKRLLKKLIPLDPLLQVFDTIIDHGSPSGVGVPIGNLSSQYFANLYLGELDLFIKNDLRVKGYLRYMDDFVLFAESKRQAQSMLDAISLFLPRNLSLALNNRALMISPCGTGLPFLGFRVFPNLIRLKRSNLIALRKKLRAFTSKRSLDDADIVSIQSLMAHIKNANTYLLRVKEYVNE